MNEIMPPDLPHTMSKTTPKGRSRGTSTALRRPLPSLLQLSRLAIEQSLAWNFDRCSKKPNTSQSSRAYASTPCDPLPPCNSPSCCESSFTIIDGTCGNGHDTLFLAETAHRHLAAHPKAAVHLLAFDVQPAAIENTKERLASHQLNHQFNHQFNHQLNHQGNHQANHQGIRQANRPSSNPIHHPINHSDNHPFSPNLRISCLLEGHELVADHCPHDAPPILAVYNLGFLPGSDKSRITTPQKSIASFNGLLPLMSNRGMLVIHAYGGHQGGKDEVEAVRQWAASLPADSWTARCYETITAVKNPESLFIIEKTGLF